MSEQDFHKIKNRNLAVFIDLFEKMLKKIQSCGKQNYIRLITIHCLFPLSALQKTGQLYSNKP